MGFWSNSNGTFFGPTGLRNSWPSDNGLSEKWIFNPVGHFLVKWGFRILRCRTNGMASPHWLPTCTFLIVCTWVDAKHLWCIMRLIWGKKICEKCILLHLSFWLHCSKAKRQPYRDQSLSLSDWLVKLHHWLWECLCFPIGHYSFKVKSCNDVSTVNVFAFDRLIQKQLLLPNLILTECCQFDACVIGWIAQCVVWV